MGAFTHFFKVRFAHPKIRLRSVHCGFLPKGKIEVQNDALSPRTILKRANFSRAWRLDFTFSGVIPCLCASPTGSPAPILSTSLA
jgi:hypothetical protein